MAQSAGASEIDTSATDAWSQRDATDRDWARESLRLALLAGGLGTWEWEIATGDVHWNATLEAIYGLPAGSFTGTVEDYRGRIHPEDRAESAKVLDEAVATRSTFETEHRVVRPDGTVRWTHNWARPRIDHRGAVTGFVGVVADITDRRVADDERERLLADAMEARADADTARRAAEWAAALNANLAATLQRSLLPPFPPDIPGVEVATRYHPALDGLAVGGDFYDVPRLGRRSWGVLLGDVCGKGADAAAVTGLVRYAARAAAIQAAAPATVLRQVNEVLRRDQAALDDPRFATMLFGRLRLRPERLEIAFSLGGHPRPYVVRGDGTVEAVGRPGTLLGVLVDTNFVNTTVSLGPGDAFVAVTDGVLEARNNDGRQLGDHLASVLAAHADESASTMAAAIEETALSWQPGPPTDDIAIVAIASQR